MMIEDADWPVFGWKDDIRPALAGAVAGGRPVVLATLFKVEGSAPRGPGAQMLFDGDRATGYFSGDCIEGDVAGHAAQVLADGEPRHLHYGTGSPWIDIRLRCGGTLHVFLERLAADSPAVRALLDAGGTRRQCRWVSDGRNQRIEEGGGPLFSFSEDPLTISRRFDPPRRVVVSGGDPGALAIARLAAEAGFETWLVRPDGPESPPPFGGVQYLRAEPLRALEQIGVDRWTAYIGATHEDHHDLAACLHSIREGAGWTGMIGARSRGAGRIAVLRASGATDEELAGLRLSPGVPGLGKSPWEVALGILAEIMESLNPARERA